MEKNPPTDRGITYRDAGVDIDAGDELVERIKPVVRRTQRPEVLAGIGGFGALVEIPQGYKQPVLVSGTDGVGTKLRLAIDTGRHDTIGIDLVAMCANDVVVQGAEPLFFLDYYATGKLRVDVAESVIRGIAEGCAQAGAALVGGETAEMPGLYTPPDYDLAGFITGWVEEDAVLGPARVRDGDALVALESSGLHTNGYALARRIVHERMGLGVHDTFPGESASVADVLLRVHRSYLSVLRPLRARLHALAHITGGGIPGNLNRAMPDHLDAEVERGSWSIPNVFLELERAGGVARAEMYRAFNMGVGMVVVCEPAVAAAVAAAATAGGIGAWRLGRVRPGSGQVVLR